MRKYLLLAVILSANYLSGFTQTSPQKRTATLFNYNLQGNLVTNYSRKSDASDVEFDDGVYAYTKRLGPRNGNSLLVLEGFGFDIPSDATIENISVRARRFKGGTGTIKEYYANLVKKRDRLPDWWEVYGTRWGDPNNPISFPAAEAEVTYLQDGSGTNSGGVPGLPYQWTPAMINDPYFGVLFQTLTPENGSVVVYYDWVEITVDYSQPPTVARKSPGMAEEKVLKGPIVYPNPFTTKANIQFTAAENGNASVELFNISGAKVRTLFSGNVIEGQTYTVTTGDALLPKGVYIYSLNNGNQKQKGKIIKIE
jgi:hypothetical protein